MPRKETLDKFAQAAGVSYNESAESTRMEGDGCYVGRSQAMVMGPDGKMILGSACEYEFDVGTRLEEIEINGAPDWVNKEGNRPGRREHTEFELKKERVQLKKVGRARANTGARNRATVSILGMQTGFKGLFGKDEPPTATRTFLFSRVIVNAKNELVMNRMLDGMAGNAAMLFGPQKAAQIAAPAAHQDDEFQAKNVTHSARPEPEDKADDFDDFPPETSRAPSRSEIAVRAITEYIMSGALGPNALSMAEQAIKSGETDPIILEDLVAKLKKVHDNTIARRAAGAA